MDHQNKFNFVIFFMVIIVMGITNRNNQKINNINNQDINLDNKKNLRCTNRDLQFENYEKYNFEIKEQLIDNEKTIKVLMRRSLFLESIINNMDMELKNLTKFIDKEYYKKKYLRFSH